MSEYKLVPVEPTLDMMWAAQEADMDHSDHDEWLEIDGEECKRMYKSMLAAAPAVQGEPLITLLIDDPEQTSNGWELGEWDVEPSAAAIEAFAKQAGPGTYGLYAAPQPAEQHPDCASQSVKSDSQAALSAESERQAPDVTQLVEALARCRHQASYSIGGEDALRIQLGKVRDIVNETLSSLAPYRKGGDA